MRPSHGRARTPGDLSRPGEQLVRIGALVFAVGVVFALIDVVPFLLGSPDRPLGVNLGVFAAPAGLGLALLGLLRQARSSQLQARARAARAAADTERPDPHR
ncbi:MAG: hypothetical protein NVSMB13_09630 [Mycobacteriales bacterium]